MIGAISKDQEKLLTKIPDEISVFYKQIIEIATEKTDEMKKLNKELLNLKNKKRKRN